MDLVSLLTTANAAGFQAGPLICLVVIYFRLSKKNDENWNKLIETLKGHDAKNEVRFTKIETHVGLKKETQN